jgi:hypothetical protein
MIAETTQVIRSLTDEEVFLLRQEITDNHGLWMKHPMNKTALDDGSSIILNWVTKINGNYQLQWTFREKFPKTWKLIESIAEGKELGKVYWHKLPPGIHAKAHSDRRNSYIWDGNCHKRLNFFFDIPDGVEFLFDGDLKNPMPNKQFEYTVTDMAAIKNHAVNNFSNSELLVMIIDILNDGVKVYDDLYRIIEADAPGQHRL